MAFLMAQHVKLLKNKSFALMMFAGTKACIFHDKTQGEKTFYLGLCDNNITFRGEAGEISVE